MHVVVKGQLQVLVQPLTLPETTFYVCLCIHQAGQRASEDSLISLVLLQECSFVWVQGLHLRSLYVCSKLLRAVPSPSPTESLRLLCSLFAAQIYKHKMTPRPAGVGDTRLHICNFSTREAKAGGS